MAAKASNVVYTKAISTKSYKTALIFAIVGFVPFLGGLLDFYAGKGLKAFIWTFSCGLMWFGVVYNLVMLLKGKYKDGQGLQIKNVD